MYIIPYSNWSTLFEMQDSLDHNTNNISQEELNQLSWFIQLNRVLNSIGGSAVWQGSTEDFTKGIYILHVSAGKHNDLLPYRLNRTYRIDAATLNITSNRMDISYLEKVKRLHSPRDWNKFLFKIFMFALSHLFAYSESRYMPPERILSRLTRAIENKDSDRVIELFTAANSDGNKLPNDFLLAVLALTVSAKELKIYRDLGLI